MADVEVHDIVEVPRRSNCVPIEMLDRLRLSATEPISKCTCPFALHLQFISGFMILWRGITTTFLSC